MALKDSCFATRNKTPCHLERLSVTENMKETSTIDFHLVLLQD